MITIGKFVRVLSNRDPQGYPVGAIGVVVDHDDGEPSLGRPHRRPETWQVQFSAENGHDDLMERFTPSEIAVHDDLIVAANCVVPAPATDLTVTMHVVDVADAPQIAISGSRPAVLGAVARIAGLDPDGVEIRHCNVHPGDLLVVDRIQPESSTSFLAQVIHRGEGRATDSYIAHRGPGHQRIGAASSLDAAIALIAADTSSAPSDLAAVVCGPARGSSWPASFRAWNVYHAEDRDDPEAQIVGVVMDRGDVPAPVRPLRAIARSIHHLIVLLAASRDDDHGTMPDGHRRLIGTLEAHYDTIPARYTHSRAGEDLLLVREAARRGQAPTTED